MISRGGYMDNIKVVVSPVIKQDGRQKIFISFIDEEDKREAEAIIPGLTFIKNIGFSDEELDEFREFLENEQGNILETARTINPLAEFFRKKK
jgi:hypothetical protein